MTHPSSLPVIRLRPNKPADKLRFGYPWVFSDQLVLDRRSRKIPAGSFVNLEGADGRAFGTFAFNADSRIAARLMDRTPDTPIDTDWLMRRIARAADMRARLYATPFYRLIHAEADGLPGVVIDRFGDVAVIQPNAAWADRNLPAIVTALREVTGVGTVVMNGAGRARKLEGLPEESRIECGTLSGPVPVSMNRATYFADLLAGQKTGLFYDQRDNHAFAARLAKDGGVLDVFSHVGGFGLAALAGGAASADFVDGSATALELATRAAEADGHQGRFATIRGDAFDVMSGLAAEGRRFDLVVCDPPAFAPNRAALAKGLRAYERVARLGAALVREGGYLVLCSCSHAADADKFREASLRGIGKAGRSGPLIHVGGAGPDHPLHPQLAESGYLKSLFFRLL